MASAEKKTDASKTRRPPATTPEGVENHMISLAHTQAELQMMEGTAPAPVVVHFLKLATEQHRLELEKIRRENLLLERRAEQIEQGAKIEELYAEAIKAMTHYQGNDHQEEYEDYD